MNNDLISRLALLTDILMLPHNGDIISSDEVEQAIADAPAVDAEPVRHGYWLRTDAYPHNVYCSYCYKTFVTNEELMERYKIPNSFCPSCGAKMDAEVNGHGQEE